MSAATDLTDRSTTGDTTMSTETRTVSDILRKPFEAGLIGKLPRVTCPSCSKGRCDEHQKAKCNVCGAYVSTRHIHIDYVGHADATSRLLEADPGWSWEPQAREVDPAVLAAAVATSSPEVIRAVLESAPPKFDLDDRGGAVGLWIRLTVGGVTRPGYGSCPSGQSDAVKVLIGDAIRNAAMRFGVAVDLWAKGDRADPTAENATSSGGHAVRGRQRESFDAATPAKPRSAGPRRTQPKAPADAETDMDWMGHMCDDLISSATTRDELMGHWDKVDEQVAAGKCTDQNAKEIRALITQRAAELGFERGAA